MEKDKIDKESWETEKEYRKGVAHGFEHGIQVLKSEIDKIRKEINEWKIDPTKTGGIPGTKFEKVDFSWYLKK
jgi:hypothetical protein